MNSRWEYRVEPVERYQEHYRTRWEQYKVAFLLFVVGATLGVVWLVLR